METKGTAVSIRATGGPGQKTLPETGRNRTDRKMNKIKLELRSKTDNALRVFATEHKAAMVGNANFTTPSPAVPVFDTALTAYGAKLDAIAAAETALAALRAEKDAARAALEVQINGRANYVELTAAGDEAKIRSAGFDVRADGTATTSMDQPGNLIAAMASNAGEIAISCDAVAKAKSYIIDVRDYTETGPPAEWRQAKVASRSAATVTGLVSGKKYAFRIRALGPNDLESPWSDEAVCMAP